MKAPPLPLFGLAIVLALGACTPPDSAPTREAPPAQSSTPSSPAPAVAPVVPEPSATPTPVATPEPLPDAPPVPGFVLYTSEQTIILPLDGSPPTLAAGLWVQDDRATPPAFTHALVLTRARADALTLPACPCLALAGGCEADTIQLRRFDPSTGAQLEDASQGHEDCACVRQPDEHAFPPFVGGDGQAFAACKGGGEQAIASLVGGRLYSSGWDWNGACHEGMSVYDAFDVDLALVPDPPPPELTTDGMRAKGCYSMEPASIERPWPVGGGETMDAEECEEGESEIFVLRRGQLWGVRDGMGHAGGSRSFLQRPARPDDCPTVNDPCGDPAPFRTLAKLDELEREHWVATDGSMALTAVKHGYSLWKAGATAAIEHELPTVDATRDVLGVRAHADVARLRTLVAKHPALGTSSTRRAPETLETDECHALHDAERAAAARPGDEAAPERSAHALGEDCYARLGVGLWRSAEASCLQGLATATEPGTRGAILYNLGRIAEAQGALPQAMEHYRDSLAARPKNATVEGRLAKLERAAARP